jgi:hypothetical protein
MHCRKVACNQIIFKQKINDQQIKINFGALKVNSQIEIIKLYVFPSEKTPGSHTLTH